MTECLIPLTGVSEKSISYATFLVSNSAQNDAIAFPSATVFTEDFISFPSSGLGPHSIKLMGTQTGLLFT